jgi:hypothetical protein
VLTALSALLLLVSATLSLFVFRPASPRYGRGVGVDTGFSGGDRQLVKYLRDFQIVYLLTWLAAGLALVASAWQLQQAA